MSIAINLNSHDKDHRLKENILKSGVLRTTRFWYKSARNNRLKDFFNIEKTNAMEFANTIDQMFTLLNTHYPDAWDIHIDILSNSTSINKIKIIIKFPQITITNSSNESHEIKDLYVVLPIRLNINDNIIVGRPEGTRGRISFAEKSSSYAHSHLPSTNFSTNYQYNTTLFCLGSGPLTDVLDRIEGTNMRIEDFEAILIFLDDFVRWESIEGVPYTYISRISEVSTRNKIYIEDLNLKQYIWNTSIPSLIDYFKEKNTQLSFNYYKDRIVLNPEESFFNSVKNYIIEKLPSYSNILIVYKDEGGDYYKYDINTNESISNAYNKYTIFRGQEYQFYVEAPTQDFISIDRYEVNPRYAELLINELNNRIYENAVRKSIIEQQA